MKVQKQPRLDFRALFESAPGLYLVLTPDLSIVAVSDAYLKATMTKREEILGRGLFDVFPDNPDDANATGTSNLRASLERVLANRAPDAMALQKYDIRRPEFEGGGFEERYWSPLNSPVLVGNEVAYIIHRVEDVTEFVRLNEQRLEERRVTDDLRTRAIQMETEIFLRAQQVQQANAELQRSEALNRTVLESAADGIMVIDETGLIQSFNPAAERIFGWKAEEVIGRNVNGLVPAPYYAIPESHLRNDLQVGEEKIIGVGREVEGLRKDGTRFPIDLAVSEVRIGERRLFAGITRDITERKRVELERDRFFTITLDLLCIAGTDGLFKRVNPSFTAVLGWPALDLLGRPFIDLVHPEDVEVTLAEVERLASGVPTIRFENRCRTVDGSYRTLLWSATPDVSTGLLYAAGHDVTEERQRERVLEEKYQELKILSDQLGARTRRIAQQNQELQRANQLKSQFLATMSHELRTPLNAIIGFSEVLKDGLAGTLEAQQLDYVSEIFQGGSHLLSLINDILDLSKIEADKVELELETVEIEPLLDNALRIIKERAAKEGISLARAIVPEVGTLLADGRRLRQILYNLLSNAVKFTPAGGSVRLEATVVGDEVEIAVQDTGIGIAADDIPRLFKPFEQIEGGLDRRFEGTGLGLALVKSLVELHGGTVGVASKLGHGSRFWVRLPRVAIAGAPTTVVVDADTPAPLTAAGRQVPNGPPRVLVIDDDANAREILRLYLTDAGFWVDTATGAREALNMIEAGPPDLITINMETPDVDGVDFLGMLAGNDRGRSVPVVIISGAADPIRARALGARAVLAKPVYRHELLALVRQLTEGSGRVGRPLVLIADDDPRDIKVVTSFFAGEPFEVATALGGRAAIEFVRVRCPDLIVLDLLMPEVSGFDVVERLRSRPDSVAVPIVVLTAKQLTTAEERTLRMSVERVFAKANTGRDGLLAEVHRILGRGGKKMGAEVVSQ